jgi:hypothetical protein
LFDEAYLIARMLRLQSVSIKTYSIKKIFCILTAFELFQKYSVLIVPGFSRELSFSLKNTE